MQLSVTFGRHSDIDQLITLKIGTLEGTRRKYTVKELVENPGLAFSGVQQRNQAADVYVVVQAWSGNKPLTLPMYTRHRPTTSIAKASPTYITLPLKYRDLPRTAQLCVELYDVGPPENAELIGGCTLSFFSDAHKDRGCLRRGLQRLYIFRGVHADPSSTSSSTSEALAPRDEMGRIEDLLRQHERGDILRVDWLDALTFREIERIHTRRSVNDENLYLYIEFPRFECPIIYSENRFSFDTIKLPPFPSSDSLSVVDPDAIRDNPVDTMHKRLTKTSRNTKSNEARDLKPDAQARDAIYSILKYPSTRELTQPEKDLIWHYRFYLTREKTALSKVLKSVDWLDAFEVRQMVDEILPLWTDVETYETLELLGPADAFQDRKIRAHAVHLLSKLDDHELLQYLMQLVQALKFESRSRHSDDILTLESFLISRATRNLALCVSLYWYVYVERESESFSAGVSEARVSHTHQYSRMLSKLETAFSDVYLDTAARIPLPELTQNQRGFADSLARLANGLRVSRDTRPKKISTLKESLATWKLSANTPLPIDPTLIVHSILVDKANIFKSNMLPLKLSFMCSRLQSTRLVRENVTADINEDYLFEAPRNTADADMYPQLDDNELDLDVDPEEDMLPPSFPAKYPLPAFLNDDPFVVESPKPAARPQPSHAQSVPEPVDGTPIEYTVIFKNGDDLRQDQLVLQLISLMNDILLKENLDLRLSPYQVLATDPRNGMVQFIASKTIQDIGREYSNGVLGYLRGRHPAPESPLSYGVHPAVLDTFIKSCAGYCVVTYILGVGDRHLENLLVSQDGHFFHVDFGFIFGRDPKPFPPAIKLCKEMIDGMGGASSPQFARFKNLCFTAFLRLKKNAHLIINLVALMVDANIPDIRLDPMRAVFKVQERFLLDLSDDESIKMFDAFLSETSYFSSVFDKIHSVAQYWRS